MKIGLFLPAWNVRQQIISVLEQIPTEFGRACAEVFVVDNASEDGTALAVLDRMQRDFPFPVNVYRNRTNLGYGGSQKAAYVHAIRQGYDVIVMLHGDGQYPPRHLPALVAAVKDPRTGLAHGSRLLRSRDQDETPWHRRLGVRVLSLLQNLASGLRLKEWFSGYRAFRCEALRAIPFQACANDYYFDVQIVFLLAQAGYRIAEIPVAKKYDAIQSPVNIFHFGRQVLARMARFPLARLGLGPSGLYCTHQWAGLKDTEVPQPDRLDAMTPFPDLAA